MVSYVSVSLNVPQLFIFKREANLTLVCFRARGWFLNVLILFIHRISCNLLNHVSLCTSVSAIGQEGFISQNFICYSFTSFLNVLLVEK